MAKRRKFTSEFKNDSEDIHEVRNRIGHFPDGFTKRRQAHFIRKGKELKL